MYINKRRLVMAKAISSPARQTLSKVRSIASIREPRPKRMSKNGRRVSAITQQLIDKIDAINEDGKPLHYETEERSRQDFPLWVADQIIDSREVPIFAKRIRLAKQAIQQARKMKMNTGITYVSDDEGGFGVYSQAYLLRQCKADHPSTGAVRVVEAEVAA